MSSFLMSVAVILFASAWLASVTGWREATTTLGRWCVVTIVFATVLRLPWRALVANAFSGITANVTFDGYGWIIIAGHVALVGWLLARRFPRFTDEGARGRRRRSVPRDGSGS